MLNGRLYIFGGINHQLLRFNDLFEFSPATKEWTLIETIGNVPTPRTFHQIIGHRNRIYLLGGMDNKQKNNDLHYLTISSASVFQPGQLFFSKQTAEGEPLLPLQSSSAKQSENNAV